MNEGGEVSEYAPNEHGEHLWVDLSAGFWDTEQPMDGWVDLTELKARAKAESNDNYEAWQKAEATLAAVQEECEAILRSRLSVGRSNIRDLLALLDGEGE